MITASGVGSGVDVDGIVSHSVSLARIPTHAPDERRQSRDIELSVSGSLRSAVRELSAAAEALGATARIGSGTTRSSDEAVFTAEVSGAVAAGAHEVVVGTLASAHGLRSGIHAEATTVAEGAWIFSSGDESFSVMASDEQTLDAFRDVINDASDNTFLRASVLPEQGGDRLVLKANASGAASALRVTAPDGHHFEEINAARNAEFTVDGRPMTSASNTVSDAIGGLTLELVGTGTASTTTSASRDSGTLRDSLDLFVQKYNSLHERLNDLSENASLENSRGDKLARDAELRLRSVFALPVTAHGEDTPSPLELGFTFDRYGALSIDEARLVNAREKRLERLVSLFTNSEENLANRIVDVLEDFTRAGETSGDREDGARADNANEQPDHQTARLDRLEADYRHQFDTVDRLISDLRTTSLALTDRLDA